MERPRFLVEIEMKADVDILRSRESSPWAVASYLQRAARVGL
jgi:hypothetical protein